MRPLRLLLADLGDIDSAGLAALLAGDGYSASYGRVENAEALNAELATGCWDLAIADYDLPGFQARSTFVLLRGQSLDVPVIVVAAAIGDDTAMSASHSGAQDVLVKGSVKRLYLAVARQTREMEARRELHRSAQALRDTQQRFRTLVAQSSDGVLVVEPGSLRIVECNERIQRLLGRQPGELESMKLDDVLEAPREEIDEHLRRALHEPGLRRDWRYRCNDGTIVEVEQSTNAVVEGTRTMLLLVVADLSGLKRAEELIWHQAYTDALTGLPNRAAFVSRLKLAIIAARREKQSFGVVIMDLDRFRQLNDAIGLVAGDAVLRELVGRVGRLAGPDDVVARSGDEILALVRGVRRPRDVVNHARRMLAALRRPFALEGRELHVGASLGASVFPRDGADEARLLRHADLALSRAKRLGGQQVVRFSPALLAEASERIQIERGLEHALSRAELEIHYQPQVDLATGRMEGCEALLRWNHPELGFVSPSLFIPIAEETGHIIAIGEWVLERSCVQASQWQRRGWPLRVAVNLSARQFQVKLVGSVAACLRGTGLDPALLELEITESLAMQDADSTVAILGALRDMGTAASIDDFGTGYSSLNSLKRFPVHTLKIDQSFVRDLPNDNDAAIAGAIVALGHGLGLHVIAEGTETVAQVNLLRKLGCDAAQGYLFSRPLPEPEMTALIEAEHRRSPGHGIGAPASPLPS